MHSCGQVQPGLRLSDSASTQPPYAQATLGAYSALMHANDTTQVAALWEGGYDGCAGASCAIFISWTEIPHTSEATHIY